MASSENIHSPLLNSSQSYLSCNDLDDEISLPLTPNTINPDVTLDVSIFPSSKTINEVNHKYQVDQRMIKRPSFTKFSIMPDVGYRLARRKTLNDRLCIISDFMCILGLTGIILMVIENEITFMNANHKETISSFLIKTIISITTIILIGLVFYYHRLDLSLCVINNSLHHWRVGLTATKIFLILFEALICAIHPIPRYFPFVQNLDNNNSTISESISLSYITMDVALGLPMFARIYLICRFIMFHSHLFRDTSSQSLGYFNQVSINFFFLIKTYLAQWPARCLLIICISLFFIGSWSLRACNYSSTAENMSMPNSMWLFIVTFTTVGYGDLTPSTYCGRSVGAITGLVGVLSTALLISVLARKLEFTRSEKYVHNFVLNAELAKERKYLAANIVKFTMKAWILRRKYESTSTEVIKAQRRLFRSVHLSQKSKQEEKSLADSCVGFPEIITIQRETRVKIRQNTQQIRVVNLKVEKIEETLVDMKQTMDNIQNTLNLLLNKISQ